MPFGVTGNHDERTRLDSCCARQWSNGIRGKTNKTTEYKKKNSLGRAPSQEESISPISIHGRRRASPILLSLSSSNECKRCPTNHHNDSRRRRVNKDDAVWRKQDISDCTYTNRHIRIQSNGAMYVFLYTFLKFKKGGTDWREERRRGVGEEGEREA